ncbi:hypothetical protein [Selenomonas ruminantium]|uniref:hypothetical protein n=1 Tax=Selenomonas ruminantium TaxID=971 RepID=UPI0026EF8868|nr:hypothetical protein [Selenomonas ruminantium]
MAKAVLRLEVFLTSGFGVEELARGLACDCHDYASDFTSESIGTCPSGGFRCPFGGDGVNCEDITAADWLRVLKVEE